MDKSRVEPTLFFIEKISFSLKLFSGHFYGQSFIKTVRGPYEVHSFNISRISMQELSKKNENCWSYHHPGIFFAILGRGPRAFQIGKISAVNH